MTTMSKCLCVDGLGWSNKCGRSVKMQQFILDVRLEVKPIIICALRQRL